MPNGKVTENNLAILINFIGYVELDAATASHDRCHIGGHDGSEMPFWLAKSFAVVLEPNGGFTSIGNPRTLGWNFVINRKGVSTVSGLTIRSPKKGNETDVDGVLIGLAAPTVQLSFTRFIFLGTALRAVFSSTFVLPAENCRFEWCITGMYQWDSALLAKNCLFRDCYNGMYGALAPGPVTAELCTFDRNRNAIYLNGGTANAKDCLFTGPAAYGQSFGILGTAGTVKESYNAYSKLNGNINIGGVGQAVNERSFDLPITNETYNRIHPEESTWFLRGRYNNLKDPLPPPAEIILADAGSKTIEDYNLDGTMSVSRHAIKDIGIIDLGFHWPVVDVSETVLPPEWKAYFGVTSEGADQDVGGADGVTNIDEYIIGTNPLKKDTDDDKVNWLGVEHGFDGTASSSQLSELRESGFASGPARTDLRLGPYLQISAWDINGITYRVYWAFDNDWDPPEELPEDSFYLRRSDQTEFVACPSPPNCSSQVEDCFASANDCSDDQDFEVHRRRITLTGLTRGALYFYKIRYQDAPTNPSRIVESPVYSFRVPPSNPSSFAFLLYSGTDHDGGPPSSEYNKAHELLADQIVSDLASPEFSDIAEKMLFAVHLGDFVETGSWDENWRMHYFWPATKLIGSLPVLPVVGDLDYQLTIELTKFHAFFDHPQEPIQNQYFFDLGKARFVIGDTLTDANNMDAGFILNAVDSIKNSPNFDWRFVFFHIPGYSHAATFLPSPRLSKLFSDPPPTRVREALFSTSQPDHNLADPDLHVTMVACGHNHQYERVAIGPPPSLPQLVLGRAGSDVFRDFPWTDPMPPYVEEDRESAVRLFPEDSSQEGTEGGWLSYTFLLVSPIDDPNVVRLRSRSYTVFFGPPDGLTLQSEEVIDLPKR